MKKILSIILALMFVITFVNAQVSISPTPENEYIQIKCEPEYKYCTQDEINQGFKWVHKNLLGQNKKIVDLEKYISNNEAKWNEDKVGGGMSFSSMVKYVKGEFVEHLKTIFASKKEIERLENRIDVLEAKILNPTANDDYLLQYAGLIKSKRTNEPIIINGFRCFEQHCIKINGIN
jgi:hypothetical protein